jgi:Up-regulated During Septation
MLKQEEALSELDSSIDDWVSKLEQAENRRTRVRQKLLEHVAAALIMQPVAGVERRENEHEHMHIVTQMVKGEMNTPPRSPTKASSPERLERVVEEVRVASPETMIRSSRHGRDVESIRIYADSDVYALLADVEEEINRMGEQGEADRALAEAEKEQKKEDTIQAGITLNAVAFEGMLAHSRSYQNIRMPTPEFV